MDRLVYIVDDKHEGRAALSFMLRKHGYETQIYGSGSEFLAQEPLDRGCVLLDVQMPKMDGFQVFAELLRRRATLPVIMLTGFGEVPLAVRAMRQGAVDFLEQPYEPRSLIEALERAFTLASNNRESRRSKADAAAKLDALAPRERQILQGLQEGMPNKGIARWLGLSPRTVETYRSNMMAKLGETRLSHALHIAVEGGLPPLKHEEFSRAGGPQPQLHA